MAKKREPSRVELKLDRQDWTRLRGKWPWAANSVDDVAIANLLQFYKPAERIRFVNELHRVLKPGCKAQIVAPHWASSRAWGDLAYEYPPIAEPWFFHLSAQWRKENAPWGTAYKCDFDATWGYGLHPLLVNRNVEYQQHAVTFWREAATDIIATLTKR